MFILLLYIIIFVFVYFAYHLISKKLLVKNGMTQRKTITFGDESAITPNRTASVLSLVILFLIWCAFTGSKLTLLHVPGPFVGDTSFTYTALNEHNISETAEVFIHVSPAGEKTSKPSIPSDKEYKDNNFVNNDQAKVMAWRSVLIRVKKNDVGSQNKQYKITHVDGQLIKANQPVQVRNGHVTKTVKGSLSFAPDKGWQMEAIWLPAPEAVFSRLIEISRDGYQNVTLVENLGWSLLRVLAGFLLGCLVGIPLGYAMGLSGWFRGWFDPIVEFMRPIPPLALIPLVIIWFGIWEAGKISLLFLAALWVMTIAARAGVSGINIAKIHAAYSLGASKFQVLIHVIIPNSLPEIFTGARVAMGVCWGTVVAAELVAAEKGAGKMIIAASKFQQTDIVIMGIILIGIIGYGIDMLMRKTEEKLVPWKGQS